MNPDVVLAPAAEAFLAEHRAGGEGLESDTDGPDDLAGMRLRSAPFGPEKTMTIMV